MINTEEEEEEEDEHYSYSSKNIFPCLICSEECEIGQEMVEHYCAEHTHNEVMDMLNYTTYIIGVTEAAKRTRYR